MTNVTSASGAEIASSDFDRAATTALDVRLFDVLISLLTFAASLAVLIYGMSPPATTPVFILLHIAVLGIPAALFIVRARQNGDLTVPALLLIVTSATGPIGAIGCAFLALSLWSRHPTPWRLRQWYDYISGVVTRAPVAHLYDELVSGRLPSDPEARVPRFTPILHGASIEEQQRVLGVIGRRYHAAFRPVLRKALRNKNGFIRAQAAAIASRLSVEEKSRLWSAEQPSDDAPRTDIATLDNQPRRP
jgi:hypothetical protein